MVAEPVTRNQEERGVPRSAFKVMLGGIFSILAGFLNQMMIAAYFGAGTEMDAYLTALVIPAYLQVVLLTGLSFVFIPAFVREETNGAEDSAWELVGTFFWITLGVLTAVAVAGSVFARNIISLTAPGFEPEKSALAARMLSVLMFSIPFAGLSSLTIGIQNARNRFFWPSFGGAVNSIGSILTVLLLTRYIGAMALPWCFTVALLLQSCVTVIPVVSHGWPNLISLTDSRILQMGKLILPFIVFGLLTRGTGVFERYFASVLPSGQISYLGYAQKISSMFQTLLATGIAAAMFPVMARTYQQTGKEGLREKTAYGLRLTLAVAVPAVLLAAALSTPMVRFLFQRGQFAASDTDYVALVVPVVMAGGLLCTMLSNIMSRSFYALKDTVTSPVVSIVGVVVYLSIGRIFANRWGYIGLAYASLIQHAIFILLLSIFLVRKLPGIAIAGVLRSGLGYGLAGAAAFLIGRSLSEYFVSVPTAVNLLVSGLVSGGSYLAVMYIFDREMLFSVLEMLGVGRLKELGKNMMAHLRPNAQSEGTCSPGETRR